MKHLAVDGTRVTSLSPLRRLTALERFAAGGKRLSGIDVLRHLTKLKDIYRAGRRRVDRPCVSVVVPQAQQ